MSRDRPLFMSSVVGSMPRPTFVRELVSPGMAKQLDAETHRRYMDAACTYCIAMQEAAGLDEITDGEWRRPSYIGVIADICEGFERSMIDGRPWTTVIAPIAAENPGVIAREIQFVREHTDRRVKATLPSPYLLGQRMWNRERSSQAYPTREAFMHALVPILNQELRLVRNAGADVVQIDDPHLCLFVDDQVRMSYANPELQADLAVDLINGVLHDVDGIDTAIHLCRRNRGRAGWVGEGGYDPIMRQLRALAVHQYILEFTIPVAGDLDVLGQLPDNRLIGLGCVDVRAENIDTPEQIVVRVEQALAHVDKQRLSLNPDCGFAPGSAAEIPIDEAYAKLANEAAAARILRNKYS